MRNERLTAAIEAAGYVGHGQFSRFCRDAGVDLSVLWKEPLNQTGFSPAAIATMSWLCALPEDLWTPEQLNLANVERAAREEFDDRYTPIDAERAELPRVVEQALDTITPREALVLRLRFGLGIRGDMTLEEVGALFDVTRERIRQTEAKALRKLKHPTRREPLFLFVDWRPIPRFWTGREYFATHADRLEATYFFVREIEAEEEAARRRPAELAAEAERLAIEAEKEREIEARRAKRRAFVGPRRRLFDAICESYIVAGVVPPPPERFPSATFAILE